MWGLFFAAVLAGAAFLYVPGMLVLLGLRVKVPLAFAFAPLLGIPVTVALAIAYPLLGANSNWASVFLPQLAVGLIVFTIGNRRGLCCGDGLVGGGDCDSSVSDSKALLLYVAAGVAVSTVMFVTFLQDPTHYTQGYDNVTHLGSIRCLVDSGNWSPFSISLYVNADAAINPLPGGGFYPAAWYNVASFVISLLGIPVALSENATNYIFVGLLYPVGMFAFMRVVFPDRREILLWGAACVLAIAAFPWQTLAWGPLFPNTAAFCLLPLVSAVFVVLLSRGVPVKSRILSLLLFLLGIAALAFLQPNAVFSLGVWMAPFLVYRATFAVDLLHCDGGARRKLRCLFAVGVVVAICLIWVTLYRLPFMQSVVQYSWVAVLSKPEAFLRILTLGFMSPGVQLVPTLFVIVGALWTLRNRQWLWLSLSFVIASALFVVDVSSDGPLQHLLTGFWYTDYYRVAAMAAILAVPLACMGVSAVTSAIKRFLVTRDCEVGKQSFLIVMAVFTLLVVGNAIPLSESENAETSVVSRLRGNPFYLVWSQNSWGNNVDFIYTTEEKEFVKKVKEALPEDALVVNNPNDGSCFCFVPDDLRVYYRYLNTYGVARETSDSKLIRGSLEAIAYDDEVKQAVRSVGAQYVLLLDQGRVHDPDDADSYFFLGDENKGLWDGIDLIRDDTPGFEPVLAQDDMRLYRITAIED